MKDEMAVFLIIKLRFLTCSLLSIIESSYDLLVVSVFISERWYKYQNSEKK